jgi:hypothetical protein
MNLNEGDKIASIAKVAHEETPEATAEPPEAVPPTTPGDTPSAEEQPL